MCVIVDYAMCEYCCWEIRIALENDLPINQAFLELLENLINSTARLIKAHEEVGPELIQLFNFVCAKYEYEDCDLLEGFAFGAILGSSSLCDAYLTLE